MYGILRTGLPYQIKDRHYVTTGNYLKLLVG